MKLKIILNLLLTLAFAGIGTAQELIPYNKKGVWGYSDINKKLIISPMYDHAERFIDGIAIVKSNNKYAVIDKENKFILKAEYSSIQREENFKLLRINTGQSIGISDYTGSILLQPVYMEITISNEGIIAKEENGSSELYNLNGKLLRKGVGLAVSRNGIYYQLKFNEKGKEYTDLIDGNGNIIIQRKSEIKWYLSGSRFEDVKKETEEIAKMADSKLNAHLAALKDITYYSAKDENGQVGVWTGYGKQIISSLYEELETDFLEKDILCMYYDIKDETAFDLYSSDGKKLNSIPVSDAHLLSENNNYFIAFEQSKGYGIMDLEGNIKIPPIAHYIDIGNNYFFIHKKEKYTCILPYDSTYTGNEIYGFIPYLSEMKEYGFSHIKIRGKYGLINENGELTVNAEYDTFYYQPKGIIGHKKTGSTAFDREGNVLWTPENSQVVAIMDPESLCFVLKKEEGYVYSINKVEYELTDLNSMNNTKLIEMMYIYYEGNKIYCWFRGEHTGLIQFYDDQYITLVHFENKLVDITESGLVLEKGAGLTCLLSKTGKQIIPFGKYVINDPSGMNELFKNSFIICNGTDNQVYIPSINKTIPITYKGNLSPIVFSENLYGIRIATANGNVNLIYNPGKNEFIELPIRSYEEIPSGVLIVKDIEGKEFAINNEYGVFAIPEHLKGNINGTSGNYFVTINKDNNKKGLLSIAGKKLLENEYDEIAYVNAEKTIYKIKKGEKWGLIDTTGKYIIPLKYSEIKIEGPVIYANDPITNISDIYSLNGEFLLNRNKYKESIVSDYFKANQKAISAVKFEINTVEFSGYIGSDGIEYFEL